MRIAINISSAAYISLASPTLAGVLDCQLEPTEEMLSPSLSVYFHNGIIHSALLEFTTDYGDVLPYLFACEANCIMDMAGDDFRYILGVEPELRNPKRVSLVTESRNDDFRHDDTLEVKDCRERP